MEFTQCTCPVCQKRFVLGDDVVVCPECGAPHHRECFEQNGRCAFEDKHGAGFDFEKTDADTEDSDGVETVVCPNCKTENEKTNFYCSKCGFPLNERDRRGEMPGNGQENSAQSTQFGVGNIGFALADPLAGMNSEDEIAEGVKVGEAAKFIGKNTQYFLLVFKRLKDFAKGKFCFSAFVFTGSYFIYRKMYALGIALCLMMIGLTVGSSFLLLSDSFRTVREAMTESTSLFSTFSSSASDSALSRFTSEDWIRLWIIGAMSLAQIGIRVFSGLASNRFYYSHCTKSIRRIKAQSPQTLNKTLEEQGGVNLPMAASFFAAMTIRGYLPHFFF